MLVALNGISQKHSSAPINKLQNKDSLIDTLLLDLPPPPLPPEPPLGHTEKIPGFPHCEDQNLSRKEVELCIKEEMLCFIYENLEYSDEAKNNSIKGIIVVQFSIDKEGSILGIKLVRRLEDSLDIAAIIAVEKIRSKIKLVNVKPGNKRGPAVTQYTIPIKYGY